MSRRAARQVALQILYKADIAGFLANNDSPMHESLSVHEGQHIDVERELAYWLKELAADKGSDKSLGTDNVKDYGNRGKGSKNRGRGGLSKENYEFALDLIRGVLDHCRDLDEKINAAAREWDLQRMDVVDRNVMRLALFEMLFCPNIPQRVSVNEAVELAKIFCGDDSAKFINGILDRFIVEEER